MGQIGLWIVAAGPWILAAVPIIISVAGVIVAIRANRLSHLIDDRSTERNDVSWELVSPKISEVSDTFSIKNTGIDAAVNVDMVLRIDGTQHTEHADRVGPNDSVSFRTTALEDAKREAKKDAARNAHTYVMGNVAGLFTWEDAYEAVDVTGRIYWRTPLGTLRSVEF